MTYGQKTLIELALKRKNALLPCSRCGHNTFSVLDKYGRIELQDDFKTVLLGGPSIPCAIVICNNCGHVDFHALGSLDLMPPEARSPAPPTKPPERSAQ